MSVNAKDFDALSAWWKTLLDRPWDREPMPSCHEWDLTDTVLFQVLDSPDGPPATVTLLTAELDREISRLRAAGVSIPDPQKVEGFETLRFTQFKDPEGNDVGLLDGQ